MSSESLLSTLNRGLNNYALERGRIFGRIDDRKEALFDAEENLKRAQEAERGAVFADDELIRKMRELTAYYNSLSTDPPRPQALLEQQTEMGREQVQTHRKRMESHEVARGAMTARDEAARDLAVAKEELKAIDARIQETNREIERLRQS